MKTEQSNWRQKSKCNKMVAFSRKWNYNGKAKINSKYILEVGWIDPALRLTIGAKEIGIVRMT